MKREYKDDISIDDVKSGEVIRTENETYYLVVKLPRNRPRFIEIDPKNYQHVIVGKITEVFAHNGSARILPTEKEI